MPPSPSNPLAVIFGRLLQNRRQKGGLSQSHLAKLSGISLKYIGEIERAEANITIETMCTLCSALDWIPFDVPTTPQDDTPEKIDFRQLEQWVFEGHRQLAVIDRMTQRAKREQALQGRGRPKVGEHVR